MTLASELAPFLALGFLGSLHCVAMCGGFAIAASLEAPSRRSFLARQLAHQLGKASTYGIVCGLIAHAGSFSGESARPLVAWLAGAGLLVLGLVQLFPSLRRSPRLTFLHAPLRWLSNEARTLPGATGRFAGGVVNGLLPCGLSAAAFLLAADRSPSVALLGGLTFGLATAPALLLTASLPRVRLVRLGRAGPRLLGACLVLFGVLTWTRGVPGPQAEAASCHDPGGLAADDEPPLRQSP